MMLVRERHGRKDSPTAGIMDAQAVNCPTSGEERGYDASKNVKGRKRHILTDVLGLALVIIVTAASVPDRNGGKMIFGSGKVPSTILKVWADKGYRGPIVSQAAAAIGIEVEIVANPSPHAFIIAKRRWVVERTNAWLSAARRLTVDREKTVSSSKTLIDLRLCSLYAKWLAA